MQGIDYDALLNYIDKSLVKYYQNELESQTNKSLGDYIMALNLNYTNYIEDLSGSRRATKKARVNTRLNWHKCALRDLENKNPEGTPMKYYEYLLANGSPDLTWNNFKDKYTKKVNDWKDNDLLLIKFPFLCVSTLFTKESAFSKELTLNIINAFENKIIAQYDTGDRAFNKDVFLQPLEFFIGPFVAVNSPGSLLQDKDFDNQNMLIKYEDYNVPYIKGTDNVVIRSLIAVNNITDQETNIRTLTTFDVSLFLYIVNYVYEKDYTTFLRTRKFQNYLVDIVRAMYPGEEKLSSRCYLNVRNSLVKLSALNVKGLRNHEVVSIINFFDSYSLDTEASGKQIVTLSMGSYMFERISTKKIQHLYSHEVALIEDKSAQFIYYLFEGERQKAYATNRINTPQEYNYTFFLHTMRFPKRSTVKANMDLIEGIFKLFMELDVLLLSYERKPRCFVIMFKSFTRDDIISLKLDSPSLLPF